MVPTDSCTSAPSYRSCQSADSAKSGKPGAPGTPGGTRAPKGWTRSLRSAGGRAISSRAGLFVPSSLYFRGHGTSQIGIAWSVEVGGIRPAYIIVPVCPCTFSRLNGDKRQLALIGFHVGSHVIYQKYAALSSVHSVHRASPHHSLANHAAILKKKKVCTSESYKLTN